MRTISLIGLGWGVLAISSCGSLPEKERKGVPPPSASSQIPWNSPVAGQGGGMMGALPKTPRR